MIAQDEIREALTGVIDPEIRRSVLLWVGCVAGALDENEYTQKLAAAGFEQIDIEPTRIYRAADAREFLRANGMDADAIAPQVDGKFMSAFGSSPQTFIMKLRIQAACEALQREHAEIHEVARAHGFCSQSAFTQLFQKYIGLTPRKYQQRFELRRGS